MAINELAVLAVKIGTSGLKSSVSMVETSLQKIQKHATNVTYAIAAIGAAGAVLGKSFVKSASEAEQYKVRLNALLGSVVKGNQLFKDMADYAGKVPFKYREIMGAATQLSGVMQGGVDEINRWMPLIGDLAAVSGLSIEQTTGQVVRMYSAGAASADMFRERGITAMLGFTAGVKYSVDDTRKMLMEAWDDPESKFKGATLELAKTWEGTMSMFSDAWFQFKVGLMDLGAFDAIKRLSQDWLNMIKNVTANSNVMQTISINFQAAFIAIHDTGIDVYTGLEKGWLSVKTTFEIVKTTISHGWEKMIIGITKKWLEAEKVFAAMTDTAQDMWNVKATEWNKRNNKFKAEGTLDLKLLNIITDMDKQKSIIEDTKIMAKELAWQYFEFKPAIESAAAAADTSLAGSIGRAKTLTEDLKDSMSTMWSSWQDSATDVLLDLGKGWQDFFDQILKDLLRLKVEQAIITPIFDGMAGGFGSFFKNIFGTSSGGGGTMESASGSVLGEPGVMQPTQNKSLASSRNGGGGGTVVQIIDKRGADAAPLNVSKQTNNSGEIIRVVIEEVKGAMDAGEFNGVMLNTFGIMPQGGG